MKSLTTENIFTAERARWWREAKFGMFAHFGLYSVAEQGEWVMYYRRVPIREYEKLMPHFNPRKGCTREWLRIARAAGAKYFILTTKHHDGFCLFDSKLTKYNSMHTAARRDIVREYVESCRAEGLGVGLYYSGEDWHHPDCPLDPNNSLYAVEKNRKKPDEKKYLAYMLGQLGELLSNYGRIDVLWFDRPYKTADAETIVSHVRKLQPGIMINDRASADNRAGRLNNHPGTYDFITPEQWVPEGQMTVGGKPVLWETTNTMTGVAWGFDKYNQDYRSPHEFVQMLVKAASGGGNFLLNMGPKPDGSIPKVEKNIALRIGKWMEKHGGAIYGTQAGPPCGIPGCRATRHGNTVYLHILGHPKNGRLALPELKGRPSSVSIFGGRDLPVTGNHIVVPQKPSGGMPVVLQLEYPEERSLTPRPKKQAVARIQKPVEYLIKRGSPIVINGSVDETAWKGTKPIRVTQETHYDWTRQRYPSYTYRGWCAFTHRWMHADGVLYGLVEVESENPMCGINLWGGDSVEFFICTRDIGTKLPADLKTFHVIIDVENRVYVAGEDKRKGLIFRVGLLRTPGGYNMALAVPFTSLLKDSKDRGSHVRSGDVIGLNVVVNQARKTHWDDPANWRTGRHLPWWKKSPIPPNVLRRLEHRVHWKGNNETQNKPDTWARVKIAP